MGGSFHWAWQGPDGQRMVRHGINLDVVPLERIVRTEKFDLVRVANKHELLATLTLEEYGGERGGQGCHTGFLLYSARSGMEHPTLTRSVSEGTSWSPR